MKRFLPLSAVADELGVSRWTVMRMVERGAFPALKDGAIVRVARDDLEAYIERHTARAS